MEKFVFLTVDGLAAGAILALAGLGFVLIYKATEVVNFAQGQLLLVGAFMVYNAQVTWGLPWPLAVLVGLASGVALGLLVERLVLRRLIGEATLSVIMVTIGLASVLAAGALLLWGVDARPRPDFIPAGTIEVLGATVTRDRVLAIILAAVVFAAVGLFFRYSRHGIAMRAVADDQQAALVMGISVNRIFAMAWSLAGASAVVGGLLLASTAGGYQYIDLQGTAVLLFPVVILGGLDSVPGTLVGGAVVGLLAKYTDGYLGAGLSQVVPFAALVLILMVKPYGLFGQVRIERV
jgi:branched-chain amino acid transport system permease protein